MANLGVLEHRAAVYRAAAPVDLAAGVRAGAEALLAASEADLGDPAADRADSAVPVAPAVAAASADLVGRVVGAAVPVDPETGADDPARAPSAMAAETRTPATTARLPSASMIRCGMRGTSR